MAPTRRQFVQDSSTLAAIGMMLSFNPLAYAPSSTQRTGRPYAPSSTSPPTWHTSPIST